MCILFIFQFIFQEFILCIKENDWAAQSEAEQKMCLGITSMFRQQNYLDFLICAISSVPCFIPQSLGQILMPFTALQSLGLTLS